jgi:hypothetical protein
LGATREVNLIPRFFEMGSAARSEAKSHPCNERSYYTPKVRFTATLGEKPEVEVALV